MTINKLAVTILSISVIGTCTLTYNSKESRALEQCTITPNIAIPIKSSLTCSAARNWYNKQLHNMPNLLHSQNVTFSEEVAHLSFLYRNYFKKIARDSMSCQTCADFLNQNEKPYTFEQLLSKYNRNFDKIAKSSIKSRESISILSKISDFFEISMPKIYEKILFPSAIYFSKLIKYLISIFS